MPAATKSITLQEDKPSLRVTSSASHSANFASASDFAFLKCLSGLEIYKFHEISASEHATGAPMQTLVQLRIFPQPMDRAEVLHAPSYDLSGRRKNTPGQNELVAEEQSSLFKNVRPHSLRPNCHSTCPLHHKVLLSKSTSRLYGSLGWKFC